MPGPIHARPIHARNGRFMPVPIHAQICSGPLRPIRARPYSCQDWFMPCIAKFFSQLPIHARAYSCPDLFVPYKTDSCPYLFMPILIHARY